MNQNELLKEGKELLKSQNVEEYEVKSKRLLEFVLKQKAEQFIIHSLDKITKQQEQEYRNYLAEIIQGKPLQYITHKQKFMNYDFYVDENVLIPQPDTEILVEKSIEIISSMIECEKQQMQILDLCTGSGVIAVSIAKSFSSKLKIIASDISSNALEIAKKNAYQNRGRKYTICTIRYVF